MKNINLLSADYKEKLYFENYLKKGVVILAISFLFAILFVFLLNTTISIMNIKITKLQSDIKNNIYIDSQMTFNEINLINEANTKLENIISNIQYDNLEYAYILSQIASNFTENIKMSNLLVDTTLKKISVQCFVEDKKNIPLFIKNLNAINEINYIALISIKSLDKYHTNMDLELFLK